MATRFPFTFTYRGKLRQGEVVVNGAAYPKYIEYALQYHICQKLKIARYAEVKVELDEPEEIPTPADLPQSSMVIDFDGANLIR